MKKTNTFTSIACAVAFIVMVLYIGSSFMRSRDKVSTAFVIRATISDSSSVHGLAVRDELLIDSERVYLSLTVADGDYVSRGERLGAAMDNEEALARESRRRELTQEISHVEALLQNLDGAQEAAGRGTAIKSALRELSAAVSGGDAGSLDGICARLSSLVFSGTGLGLSEDELDAMRAELRGIETSTYSDSEAILAPESGLFSEIIDGYEGVSRADLDDLTVASVGELLASRDAGLTAAGKLVIGSRWYFAAVMDAERAEELTEGSYVTLSFDRRYGGDVRMRVDSISTASGGERAVLFSSLEHLEQTLPMREAEAEIVSAEYAGLRVPARALHVAEDGRAFVYVVTSNQVEIKYVNTLFQSGDYFIVELESSAYSLRDGNEVVLSGEVYDGQILDR